MVSAMEKQDQRIVNDCEDAWAHLGLVVGMLGGAAGGVAAGIPVGIAVTGAVTITVGSGGLAAPFIGLVVGFVTYGGVGMAGAMAGTGAGAAVGHEIGKAKVACQGICNGNDSDDDSVSGDDDSDDGSDSEVTGKLPGNRGTLIPQPQQTAQAPIHYHQTKLVLKPPQVVRASYIHRPNQAAPSVVPGQTVGPARQTGFVGLGHPVVHRVVRRHHGHPAYTRVPTSIMAPTTTTTNLPRYVSVTTPSSASYVVLPGSNSPVSSPPQTPQISPRMRSPMSAQPTPSVSSRVVNVQSIPPLDLKHMQGSASTISTTTTRSV